MTKVEGLPNRTERRIHQISHEAKRQGWSTIESCTRFNDAWAKAIHERRLSHRTVMIAAESYYGVLVTAEIDGKAASLIKIERLLGLVK